MVVLRLVSCSDTPYVWSERAKVRVRVRFRDTGNGLSLTLTLTLTLALRPKHVKKHP